MSDITALNKAWGIDKHLSFKLGAGDMPVIEIKNAFAQAVIALQGAHILSFQPKGEQALIWMSDDAVFATGKSLRGGIPVCWPWFGAHPSNPSLPAHGPARTASWYPTASGILKDGRTFVRLELEQNTQLQSMCKQPLSASLHITIGKSLEIYLETKNLGDSNVTLGQALHSYFYVSDVRQVHVEGLDACEYLDKVEGFTRKQQLGSVTISQEVDRVYVHASNHIRIIDSGLKRAIHIHNHGSSSVVVWNPWAETAAKMGDLGRDGYLNMLCVETANAFDDTIILAPGASHVMATEYRIESI
ncbi:MAG: D-hexose-6-phosphate mutarotase [Mariprofundaceae bacterium]|nr:D-hexose-6-phosphate mutarotase [Mariprofundaceae bacterium]